MDIATLWNEKLKGFRTVIANAAMAGLAAFAAYLANVDWATQLGITGGAIAAALANYLLRTVTDTPIFTAAPKQD